MSFLNEIIRSMARVFGRILAYILIGFLIWLIYDHVYAQDLYFVRPRIHALTNNLNADPIVLREFDSRVVGTLQDYTYNANRVFMSYRINQNIVDDSITYIPVGTYKIKITSGQFQTINSNTTSFLTALRVFDASENSYISASCDVTPTFTTTSVQGNRYNWSYECDEFTVTRNDLSFLAIIIYSSNSNINYNSITANMQLIDITNEKDNQAIIDNQNQNTQDMIENNNQNTQDIIDNQNQNTQDIIDNQNQNTQDTIDSQKVCEIIDLNSTNKDNTYINTSGEEIYSSNWNVTDYIKIDEDTKIEVLNILSYGTQTSTCFYNINKVYISCIRNDALSVGQELTIPTNTSYVRFSINKNENKPQFKICKNGNQAIIDSQNQTNQTLTGISSWLNSNTSPDVSSVNSFPGMLPPGPVDSLLLLPLQFLNMLNSAFSNNSCPTINLTIPIIGGTFRLKCLNEIWVGISNFETIVNILLIPLIGFYLYKTFMSLYNYIHDILLLNGGSLYNKWKEWGGI